MQIYEVGFGASGWPMLVSPFDQETILDTTPADGGAPEDAPEAFDRAMVEAGHFATMLNAAYAAGVAAGSPHKEHSDGEGTQDR